MESVSVKPKRLHYAYVVLFTCALVALGTIGLSRMAYPVILPAMKAGLGLTYEQTGWLATWNFIGYLLLCVVSGFLATRFGPRLVIGISLTLLGVTLIGTGLAPDFTSALIMRTLSGLGNGGSFVPMMALTAAWFTSSKRGLANGLITSGTGTGLVLSGMLLPGVIAGQGVEGWRYAWYLIGAIVVFVGLISLVLLRNRPQEMGLAPFGSTPGSQLSAASTTHNPGFAATARAIYRMPALWHLSFVYSLFGFSYVLYSTFFAAYLTKEGGMTEAAAGGLWALTGLVSIGSGSIWGTVSDIWGRKYGLALVYVVQTISYATFAAWPTTHGFYASAILFGLTAWSIPAIVAAASGDYGGPKLAPAVLGSVTLFYSVGQAVGPVIGGRIADTTGSFALTFYLAAAVAALGAITSLGLRPAGHKPL